MSNHPVSLGRSATELVSQAGCYIATLANMITSKRVYEALNKTMNGGDLPEFSKPTTVLDINNRKNLFAANSGRLNGRDNSMNALFGSGTDNWDYWTKDFTDLAKKLEELDASGTEYMVAGIFNLSKATEKVDNHMVGITGLPNEDGIFDSSTIVPSSNGDRNRLSDDVKKQEYNINNLKEIRVILIDSQ